MLYGLPVLNGGGAATGQLAGQALGEEFGSRTTGTADVEGVTLVADQVVLIRPKLKLGCHLG